MNCGDGLECVANFRRMATDLAAFMSTCTSICSVVANSAVSVEHLVIDVQTLAVETEHPEVMCNGASSAASRRYAMCVSTV